MGGAPYIGLRPEDGLIFKVSLSQLDAKKRPGKLPTRSSLFEYSLAQVRSLIEGEGRGLLLILG